MTTTTERTVSQQLTSLASLASLIGGKAWGADKGRPRIYMRTGRKDCKVFFSFNDVDSNGTVIAMGGASLKVYIDDCGQAANWYKSQKNMLRRRYVAESLALAASALSEQLAADIMDNDLAEVSDNDYDTASNHIANGRVNEAREALGL